VALREKTDRRGEDRNHLLEHTRVAGERKRLFGVHAEQQLRELPHPVRGQPPADTLGRDQCNGVRLRAHLGERRLVGNETELGDEAEPAHEPEGVLGEASRAERAQDSTLEIAAAAEGIDELAVGEAPRERVDGEVPPGEIILDAPRRVDDDLEVVAGRAGRTLAPHRCELDTGRSERAQAALARDEPHADRPPGDDELLDPAVGRERLSKLGAVESGHQKIRVLGGAPEELIANDAAHEVGVEAERADVGLDCL